MFIHIGKCGGGTLRTGIANATVNTNVHIVHMHKPVLRRDLKYIIVARNPIGRAISAFRWRYKLVVEDKSQTDRRPGEHDILVKYRTFNALAEALYHLDGTPNIAAQEDIRKIHHLREDISFYLSELLEWCQPEQILAVLMQENLDEDIYRVFGYKNELETHRNPYKKTEQELSVRAQENLKKFLVKDYEALTKLYCWGKIDEVTFRSIM